MSEKLEIGILLVNGCHNYKDRLWLEISLGNIIGKISKRKSYKVFVWNHDVDNQKVIEYLNSFGSFVEVLNESNCNLKNYDPDSKYKLQNARNTFAGGYHVHRTPLQLLFDYSVSKYEVDKIFTFDSDACPVRSNWDVSLTYALENGKQLTGILRDELVQVMEPYIHPSCLGIKVQTIRELNLRFDQIPVRGKQDSLSHFTSSVVAAYGSDAVYPLRRTNRLTHHTVFNGIYGNLIYHHHFGTRNRDGKSMFLRSFGWKERDEKTMSNRFIMDGTTEMLFRDTRDFLYTLLFGPNYLNYKLYAEYLATLPSKYRMMKLFHYAKEIFEKDSLASFFILLLIHDELSQDRRYINLFINVCLSLGMDIESAAYTHL